MNAAVPQSAILLPYRFLSLAGSMDSGRTGFYFRVLTEGRVRAGDVITLIERDSCSVSIAFANHVFHHARQDRDGIDRVLSVPALSGSWRTSLQELRKRAEGEVP
jgi:MOSC domain-containing protein YiiM